MLSSCKEDSNTTIETPWGSSIAINGTDTVKSKPQVPNTFNELLASGQLLVATLSGPDTYYEYHGTELGTQYLLCLEYAKHIGVTLRVEVCRDEEEIADKLHRSQADIGLIASDDGQLAWQYANNMAWLADSVSKWYSPERLTAAKQRLSALTAQSHNVVRRVYAPIANRGKGIISAYDHLFKRYAPFALIDWRLMAAQCYQESCFDPNARSWAGACGLMQIMPSTASSLGLSHNKLFSPEDNIATAALYLRQLNNKFSDIGSSSERLCFVLAAYNGGSGHIRDAMALARKMGKNSNRWNDVAQCVLLLMQPKYYRDPVVKFGYMRGSETVDYVARIRERYRSYSGIAIGSGSFGIGGSRMPAPATKNHKYKIRD